MSTLPHRALFDDGDLAPDIPVCDHYCGTEPRMRKALALQAERGPVFDVTLDCEDGAPIGREAEHARLVGSLVASDANAHGRVGVRVHPWDHPSFAADLDLILAQAASRVAYVMVPKPRGAEDVRRAIRAVQDAARSHGRRAPLPVHTLIETHGALRDVDAIAALPGLESLSFGLMDFVSAHRGAIPQSAMTMAGQFSHPLVVRAKLDIAAAAHAHAKVPSHCVVTEFRNTRAIADAARRAAREFGCTRMWSIHPAQIDPIVEAFAPTTAEIDEAIAILRAAMAADYAPIRHTHADGEDLLHDRASYRYYAAVLDRARRTGQAIPVEARQALFGET